MRASALALLIPLATGFAVAAIAGPAVPVASLATVASMAIPAPPTPAEPISGAFLQSHVRPYAGPGPIKSFFSLLLGAYRNGVSPADGPTCAFQPTCSGYAGIAIHRHGLAEGILLTGDRLMRCNGYDKSAYPMVGRERRFLDPVP